MSTFDHLRVAVLLPCYNEGQTIASVVKAFRDALPRAIVYVYDNNSRDNTAAEALAAGAIVRNEPRQGKGSVVRRMFADIDADYYIMADGDLTYDASKASILLQQLIDQHLDMLVAARQADPDSTAYRQGHRTGNLIFNRIVRLLFQSNLQDIFSGYRFFSRRFVKSFPISSAGFEIETDLSVHALELQLPIAEVPVVFFERPEGSHSKLKTFRDGGKILFRLMILFKEVHPFTFFASIASLMMFVSLLLGYPLVTEYLHTGLVPRLPTAVLAMGLMILAFISLASGTILDSVARARRETKRLFYIQQSKGL